MGPKFKDTNLLLESGCIHARALTHPSLCAHVQPPRDAAAVVARIYRSGHSRSLAVLHGDSYVHMAMPRGCMERVHYI
jgi:hypothetical protein